MGTGPALDPDLVEAIRSFVEETGVEHVIVFGSQATGTAGEHSDVDLLVIDPRFEGQRPFERPVPLYDHWPDAIPADFVCYTPEEVEEARGRATIVQAALDEGIVVG